MGYNAQAAADTETHLIVTHDVINDGHDREQLSPMAKGAKAALGRDEMSVVADKGYFSGWEKVRFPCCDAADCFGRFCCRVSESRDFNPAALGSTRSFECFSQMTAKRR